MIKCTLTFRCNFLYFPIYSQAKKRIADQESSFVWGTLCYEYPTGLEEMMLSAYKLQFPATTPKDEVNLRAGFKEHFSNRLKRHGLPQAKVSYIHVPK